MFSNIMLTIRMYFATSFIVNNLEYDIYNTFSKIPFTFADIKTLANASLNIFFIASVMLITHDASLKQRRRMLSTAAAVLLCAAMQVLNSPQFLEKLRAMEYRRQAAHCRGGKVRHQLCKHGDALNGNNCLRKAVYPVKHDQNVFYKASAQTAFDIYAHNKLNLHIHRRAYAHKGYDKQLRHLHNTRRQRGEHNHSDMRIYPFNDYDAVLQSAVFQKDEYSRTGNI